MKIALGSCNSPLGQALLWMTALAVFMAATHYMKDSLHKYFDKEVIHLTTSCLAVGLATMWLILGDGWIAIRFLALLLLIGLGTVWSVHFDQFFSWWEAATLLGCEAVVTAASLVVVRLAG